MFDLPYIITHPLLQRIMVRHAQLKEQAEVSPAGSAKRKGPERRISRLEQYRLPKEDQRDRGEREDIFDPSGQKIGERHSVRKRMIEKRRGRPEEFTIKTRAAFEEKLANPKRPWRAIAAQFEFHNADELRRGVRRLKEMQNAKKSRSRKLKNTFRLRVKTFLTHELFLLPIRTRFWDDSVEHWEDRWSDSVSGVYWIRTVSG